MEFSLPVWKLDRMNSLLSDVMSLARLRLASNRPSHIYEMCDDSLVLKI